MASASIALPRPGAQGLSHGEGRPVPVLPLVTIIMPIRHEARSMARALPAVLAQDYPADNMAIVVVNGMSEDGTCALVTAMAGGEPRVQCMTNPERIVPTALNQGVRATHGESIICVDGHAVMRPITAGGVWRRWQYAPLLPLACMTLHLGYSLGCLRGSCPGRALEEGHKGLACGTPRRARAARARRRSPETGAAPETP